MCDSNAERLRLAVLIDGDNLSPQYADEMLTKLALQGEVVIRQVFGDFVLHENSPWNTQPPHPLGIEPVQVDRLYQGCNSTDLALIARAKALAKAATIDGVCVASSDGDFACLADLLNKANKLFLVAAPLLASRTLVEVCDRYIDLDGDYQAPNDNGLCSRQLWLLANAIAMHTNKNGWAKLSAVSRFLRCHSPSYAKNKWGYRKLTKLLRAVGCFDIRKSPGGPMRTRRKTKSDPKWQPTSSPTRLPLPHVTDGDARKISAPSATSE